MTVTVAATEVTVLRVRNRVVMTTLEPSNYAATLEDLKRRLPDARYAAQRRVNTEPILIYQWIGQTFLERTESKAWGSRAITQLANDLRSEFPEMKSFSPSNLKYVRLFARGWPDSAPIGQQPAAQLPWATSCSFSTSSMNRPGFRSVLSFWRMEL